MTLETSTITRKVITMPGVKKCKVCRHWKPNKRHNYTFGFCKKEGDILPPESRVLGGGYKDEQTRRGNKTRPWHICDKVSSTTWTEKEKKR